MHPRTLWSISRTATFLVAVVATSAVLAFVLALIDLPATSANTDTTLVLGPFTALPLAALVLSAGLLVSCVAVFTLRSWGRLALVAILKLVGFASVLVLVFFVVLISQPGALTASVLAFAAPSIAAFRSPLGGLVRSGALLQAFPSTSPQQSTHPSFGRRGLTPACSGLATLAADARR